MTALSRLIKRQLDEMRRVGVGSGAVLTVLEPAREGGYQPVLVVSDGGWTLEDPPMGGVQQIVIVEHGDVIREVLLDARLFDVDGVVYNIAGGYKVGAPAERAEAAEWTFPVVPTSETR